MFDMNTWLVQADYTILKEDPTGSVYSMIYTCILGSIPGKVNYCIHIMSRTPELDDDLTASLLEEAEQMGLNFYNMPFLKTQQEGCWWRRLCQSLLI